VGGSGTAVFGAAGGVVADVGADGELAQATSNSKPAGRVVFIGAGTVNCATRNENTETPMSVGTLVALILTAAPFENAKPIVENEEVAVWDVTWTDGQTSRKSDQDTVVVFLTSGSAELTGSDGATRVVSHGPRDVGYLSKGSTMRQRGASKEALRTIVIQLKAPPPPALANTSGLPDAFDRPGISKALENEHVTAWKYTWESGKRTPLHFHARDVVVVYFADGVLKSITPDGKSVLNPNSFGFTKFSPRGRVHYEELAQGSASAVMVELK